MVEIFFVMAMLCFTFIGIGVPHMLLELVAFFFLSFCLDCVTVNVPTMFCIVTIQVIAQLLHSRLSISERRIADGW